MYIGHFAVGMGSKRAAPRTSLGTLLFAANLLDLIWPILVLLGIERVAIEPGITRVAPLNILSCPFSHSLLFVLIWATLFGAAYWVARRYLAGAVTVWCGVVSHWVLDAITHRPDLPLTPWSPARVGLGLWHSLAGTVIVEGGLFVLGIVLYARATRAKDRVGTYGLWGLVALLALTYVGNVSGAPPPSVTALAVVGLALWLLVAWGWWVDRHRDAR